MTGAARTVAALARRALNEIFRVPGAAIPGILAPTIFMLGLSSVFGNAVHIPHFGVSDFRTYIVPVGLLQAAGFTGAATGVNLARDIEQGWFDRLLLSPTPRVVLLAGIVSSASLRALLPSSFLLLVATLLGVRFPGFLGIVVAALLVMGLAMAIAFYAVILALRFRTQQAAPLMQMGGFIAVLFTSAYAPRALLTPWLRTVSDLNPVTDVLTGVRQGFIGSVTWADTGPALLALGAMLLVLGALAVRGLRRTGV
ncbi:MAG: type transport system permease protein [Solirubrobacteraceae bacterium]|nr:type transport system permease protein [Solirubrobacteraceae bacterium]